MTLKIKKIFSIIFYTPIHFILSYFYKICVYDTETTLSMLNKKKCSISRFGDAEFDLMQGKNLLYQKFDSNLADKLCSILAVRQENPHCLIAIPHALDFQMDLTRNSKSYWSVYSAKNRVSIYKYLKSNYKYYDSQVTRIWINRKNKYESYRYFELWKNIWKNKKVLIIEGQYTRFGVNNDLFDNVCSVERIICPSENAFDYYEKIKGEILKYSENKIALIILGPTATALAYDLSLKGVWAIDIGNLDMEYEWSRTFAEKQIAIQGKYTVEAKDGIKVDNLKNPDYLRQIICRIGC